VSGLLVKIILDYVIRRFNPSSAGLKKLVGLKLVRSAAQRDLQIWMRQRRLFPVVSCCLFQSRMQTTNRGEKEKLL
jgi:hypothetical protein